MSADNYHAVIYKDGAYYVVDNLSASVEDYNFAALAEERGKRCETRGEALEYAHDGDWTEYGVIEVRA